MKHALIALTLLSVSNIALAAPAGGSSTNQVTAGTSSLIPFGAGAPGIAINGSSSINLGNGPVKYIAQKYGQTSTVAATAINGNNVTANVDGTANAKYLTFKDVNPVVGLFNKDTLGQIWYEKRANDTAVYSIRQIADPSIAIAPKFGGLVIAQVGNNAANTVPAVYFGEWAPKAANPSTGSSTDLNMSSAERTVWYVGDNPTGNTTGLATATYNVVGINKHTPGQNDFYTGSLTANFTGGSLSGNLTRGTDNINFAGTTIANATGTFSRGTEIKGQFYGTGAAAVAGIVDRAGAANDVAFGGRKN